MTLNVLAEDPSTAMRSSPSRIEWTARTRRGRGRRVAKDQICSAVAVKTNTPMQPRLNTVAEAADLFNLDR